MANNTMNDFRDRLMKNRDRLDVFLEAGKRLSAHGIALASLAGYEESTIRQNEDFDTYCYEVDYIASDLGEHFFKEMRSLSHDLPETADDVLELLRRLPEELFELFEYEEELEEVLATHKYAELIGAPHEVNDLILTQYIELMEAVDPDFDRVLDIEELESLKRRLKALRPVRLPWTQWLLLGKPDPNQIIVTRQEEITKAWKPYEVEWLKFGESLTRLDWDEEKLTACAHSPEPERDSYSRFNDGLGVDFYARVFLKTNKAYDLKRLREHIQTARHAHTTFAQYAKQSQGFTNDELEALKSAPSLFAQFIAVVTKIIKEPL